MSVPIDYPVFISYRRAESYHAACGLRDALAAIAMRPVAFVDESGVDVGEVWEDKILTAAQRARVMIVLAGKNWLGTDVDTGKRRIDDEHDFCRREVELALEHGLDLLPLLERRDKLPVREALPESIQSIHAHQAIPLTVETYGTQLAKVLNRLRELLPEVFEQATIPAATPTERARFPNNPNLLANYRQYLRVSHANLISFPEVGNRALQAVHVDIDVQLARFPEPEPTEETPHDKHKRGLRTSYTLEGLLALAPQELPSDPGSSQPRRITGHWRISGHAGAGKSTIARHLAWELAASGEDSKPIAVYVPLATMAAEEEHPFDLAERAFQKSVGAKDGEGLADELRRLARKDGEPGRVWLLLDGLDEVAPEHLDTLLGSTIPGLAGDLCHARIAVLGRPVVERSLPEAFVDAELKELTDAQQRDLVGKWLEGEQRADALMNKLQSLELLESLRSNPLMLTLLVQLWQEGHGRGGEPAARLPANRHDLYHRAIDLLLRKSHGLHTLEMSSPTNARTVLAGIALALQGSKALAWTEDELRDAIRRARRANPKIADPRIDEALSEPPYESVDQFLGELRHRSGILGPFEGPDSKWRFLHRQFREFLAAEAMAKGPHPWEQVVGTLDDDSVPLWSETLGFYMRHVPERADAVLDAMCGSQEATLRALEHVVVADADQLIGRLWHPDMLAGDGPEDWSWGGDTLRQLCVRWATDSVAPRDSLRDALLAKATPQTPIRVLAWLHFALRGFCDFDEGAFFEQIGRPMPESEEFDWVSVPGGKSVMGSPKGEPDRLDWEGPQHEVRVTEFGLLRCAVTNAQYARFDTAHEAEQFGGEVEDPSGHPVVNVDWWSAYLFSAWVGGRLPSEAEWEYGCRAGTRGPFSFEGELTPELVNYDGDYPYDGAPKGKDRGCTVPVGELPANGWGLHEMHGNVLEWCQDRWHESYEGAPVDGSAWEVGGSGSRVVRGGSWISGGWRCRSASRGRFAPGYRRRFVGFRPARSH